MNHFASIAGIFEPTPEWPGAVQQLSENPAAMAEVLVLLTMALAGGVAHPSQMTAFEQICERHFCICRRVVPDLHRLFEQPQALPCGADAFVLPGQLDTDARTALLDDMMRIARASSDMDVRADKLIRGTASLFGPEPGTGRMEEKDEVMTDAPHKGTSLGQRVRGFLDQHASLNKVAHDPVLTAELLLLVRMSFADKVVDTAEADAFAAICTRLLGLSGDELTDILKYLNDFGYETTDAQAAEMLAGLDDARKREILNHLAIVAKADGEVDERERRLLEATARKFGLG